MESVYNLADMPSNEEKKISFREERIAHWDRVAKGPRREMGRGYHKRLAHMYRMVIPEGLRVLEIGCGRGDLLDALKPSDGVGVDFSPEMVREAEKRYSHLRFVCADAHDFRLEGVFDAVVLSDILNDLWDVQQLLRNLKHCIGDHTRIVINNYSRLWQPILSRAARWGWITPTLEQSWFTREDLQNMLHLEGYEVVKHSSEVLFPFEVPLLAPLANRFLSKLPGFRLFDLTNMIVARRLPPAPRVGDSMPKVTVVVAARNEEGNIPELFRRIPEMGGGTEIIFVEGGSKDDTYGAIERAIPEHPGRKVRLMRQPGKGKGDAVRTGFAAATGDILMILDADMTVSPEDLPRFYQAVVEGRGEFINGVRLVYPMEKQAMRFFNLIGNKFFSLAFSWMLSQTVKDTLCGTKVMTKKNYDRIAANRSYFGDFDPFGDFDLLFGAAKQSLRIVDMPVRYGERTYGDTNIERWKHGVLLLRMVVFAAKRIKFI